MKTICIYHKNCFDGICAAWVVHRKYPNAEFMSMAYSDSLDWLTQGWNQGMYESSDRLIIVDFSFKRNIMENLNEMFIGNHKFGNGMLVLDHHKTVEEACRGLDFCHFDMNESGASLAWKYFFPNESIPMIVRYIKDRDLWLFKELHSKEINAYIQSWPMNIDSYDMLYNQLDHDLGYERALQGGVSIERYKETMVNTICNQLVLRQMDEFLIPTVATTLLFSEVGHELCKRWPTYPFSAYYYDRMKDGIRQWGLRSIGDFDVSNIAKRHGGGGHKNAAGFEEKL